MADLLGALWALTISALALIITFGSGVVQGAYVRRELARGYLRRWRSWQQGKGKRKGGPSEPPAARPAARRWAGIALSSIVAATFAVVVVRVVDMALPEGYAGVLWVNALTALAGVYVGRALTPLGLTGGIASGKSTVAALLHRAGMEVIDADAVAREVVEPGQPAYRDIVAAFGADAVLQAPAAAGSTASSQATGGAERGGEGGGGAAGAGAPIDRAKLGTLVFGARPEARAARRTLNRITHPRIVWTMLKRAVAVLLRPVGRGRVCLDAALLVEGKGGAVMCFPILVVACSQERQLARLARRNPELTATEREARVASQATAAERLARAGPGAIEVPNDGSLEELGAHMEAVLACLDAMG